MVLKLIKEVIKVGEATVLYPFVPVDVTPGFRGKPQHNPELCIACAACAIACPSNALTMETDVDQGILTWSLFLGRCIYCARCEEVCPTGAIQLGKDFELAVMNKEDLFERADYKMVSCRRCGVKFTSAKEIEYVATLLEQAGLDAQELIERRTLLEICPECKRKMDVPKLMSLYQEVER